MTTSPENTLALHTIPEVADLLRVSDVHVYRLIDAGELPTVDISVPGSKRSKRRVRAADLNEYLKRASAHHLETYR